MVFLLLLIIIIIIIIIIPDETIDLNIDVKMRESY